MKNLNKFVALVTTMALCGGQIQGQDYQVYNDCANQHYCAEQENGSQYCDESCAYCDSGKASYWSAAIPVGAAVIAAIIIASNHGSGHKHGSSGGGGGGGNHRRPHCRSSSSSFSHH